VTHPAHVVGVVVRAVADSSVSPGVLGFVVVALLGVATWLLLRSMNRQIRKIDIPQDESRPPTDGVDGDDSSDRERSADG
jgi:hypothetical protein